MHGTTITTIQSFLKTNQSQGQQLFAARNPKMENVLNILFNDFFGVHLGCFHDHKVYPQLPPFAVDFFH